MSSKLAMRDAELIRVFREFGFTTRQLANEYQVDPDTVRNIVNGKSFTGETRKKGLLTGHVKHRKLTADQVRKIRALAAEGFGEQKIEKLIGRVVAHGTIRQVVSRKTYQDVV